MNTRRLPGFSDHDSADRLALLTDLELDALAYGVVEMNHDFVVVRYNATESARAGLPCSRVVGRHFFRDVAPCSNNRHVAERYEADTLDETISYTFSLRMKPVPVVLRMLKSRDSQLMYLLVTWPA